VCPSDEVEQAVGAAPSASERLAEKRGELAQAEKDLDAAELRYDVAETVRLQATVAALRRMVVQLEAKAAVEGAAEARAEAAELHKALRLLYAAKLEALGPDIDQAVKVIRSMTDCIRKCARTWNQAAHARFELDLLRMRFALEDGEPLDVLPLDPLAAVTSAFYEAVDQLERLCHRESLPVVSTIASDSPEQLTVKGMVAAAAFVAAGGAGNLSAALVQAFAKAAPVPATPIRQADEDGAFIPGEQAVPLPAGAVQTALAAVMGDQKLTEREQRENERARRNNARHQADVARANAEAARRIKGEDEMRNAEIRQRKLKALEAMRQRED
jgi:hypothetical protein